MKKFLTIWDKNNQEIENSIIPVLEEIGSEIGVELCYKPLTEKNRGKLFAEISKMKADYFLVFDMAGFQQSTLQEVSVYNIIPTIQIHFLFGNDRCYSPYLSQPLALNLFLVVCNDSLFRKYKRIYPHLLNLEYADPLTLKKSPSESELIRNKAILFHQIKRVYDEIENVTQLKEALQLKTSSQCGMDN